MDIWLYASDCLQIVVSYQWMLPDYFWGVIYVKIAKLQRGEIKTALELVWTVFQEFDAPDYSEEGVEEFSRFFSYNDIIDKFDKGELFFWGCFDSGELTGIIATRGINHIIMLYVKKEYHKRGIARSLIRTVEETCRSQNNIDRITVNAAPYAVEFYHRLGFVDTDKEQTIKGVRFTPMTYLLS